jgi:hypothetical protein
MLKRGYRILWTQGTGRYPNLKNSPHSQELPQNREYIRGKVWRNIRSFVCKLPVSQLFRVIVMVSPADPAFGSFSAPPFPLERKNVSSLYENLREFTQQEI